MITRFVEYDDQGEIFHICTVETTEGDMPKPHPNAPDEEKVAHAQAVQEAIAAKAAQTRAELKAHTAAGKLLLVLPDGAELPEHGRHFVKQGKLVRRSDTEHQAWLAAQEPKK